MTKKSKRVAPGSIWIGPAGWSYPDWEGVVYPRGAGDRLQFIARHFPLVEVNSSFYRIPTQNSVEKWVERVADYPDFLFSVKLWRGFTHNNSPVIPDHVEDFQRSLKPLSTSGRLGALLMQFPWSFRFTPLNRDRVRSLAEFFNPFHPVLEVRHGSWDTPQGLDFIRNLNMGLAAIDQPLIGKSLGPVEEPGNPVGYVRLHGRNRKNWFREKAGRDDRYDYLYSPAELSPWCERIQRIAAGSAKTLVVMNNHFQGQAVVNALELISRLTGSRVPVPEPLADKYPRLETIRDHPTDSQRNLFTCV